MPIRRIKAQSPDPYLGKIQGDTELARLAHLNYVIDAINNGAGGGGGSLTVNGNGPVNNLYITFNSTSVSESYDPNTNTYGITYTPEEYDPGYNVYRAKIATESIEWPGYGYLYNWYAVDDARGLANPSGGTGLTAPNEWRVSSEPDWSTLDIFAGGTGVAGGKLKSTLTSTSYPFYGWTNAAGTDNYNFSALPGSFRDESGSFSPLIGVIGVFWTSNSVGISAIARTLDGSQNLGAFSINKGRGNSIRLVREATASELLLNDGDTSDTSSLDPYTGNDGKTYVTVKIGTQIWLAQNIRETQYANGDPILNLSSQGGGDTSNPAWINAGNTNTGAYTAYTYIDGTAIPYDPDIITIFYNDVLENTLGLSSPFPIWIKNQDGSGVFYILNINRPWNKTHIKITPGYATIDFPTITEKSLLIEDATTGINYITFRPTERNSVGAITIEDLNNYSTGVGNPISYIYLEIIEYITESPYYYSGLFSGIGISNLEEEELLTYEINGVTYTEDPEVKRLSKIYVEIYKQLGINLNPSSV